MQLQGEEEQAFEPTLADILVVRAMLLRAGMVADLIDEILDYAEYWMCSKSQVDMDVKIRAGPAPGLSEEYHGNQFLLRSWPVGLPGPNPRDFSIASALGGLTYQTGSVAAAPLEKPCGRAFLETLACSPLTRLDRPVRKVVFRMESHDQGWTTHSTCGAFHNSCSWFDVGIERFDDAHTCRECRDLDPQLGIPPICKLKPIEPPPVRVASPPAEAPVTDHDGDDAAAPQRWRYALRERFNEWEIQRNRVANFYWVTYGVTWRATDRIKKGSAEADLRFLRGENPGAYEGRFVRELRVGDVITVWGRCVQAGWENYVRSVEIDVYWAV